MNEAYLLTGGNMGDRTAYLQQAAKLMEENCGEITRHSSIYKTAAWGFTAQADFYNQVLLLRTELSAEDLMQTVLRIEEEMGRKRLTKMGPRIIDIDILFFNDEVVRVPFLTIPHPHLHERRFTLIPLAEIAPHKVHPVLHQTIEQLLDKCADTLPVHKISTAS